MALKGNLSSVKISEVLQTLSQGHSTGLLRIQAPDGARFVEIQDGAISVVARTSNRIPLGDLLLARGLIDQIALQKALQQQKQTGKLLGQALIDLGLTKREDLEAALKFQIEEEMCDLVMLKDAEFDFVANAGLDAKMALGGGFMRLKIDPNSLLLEAARRMEEWKSVEQRVVSQAMLFQISPDGLHMIEHDDGLSSEGQMLLRLAKEERTVESMVQKACLGRLNTNLLLLELWDHGLLQPLPADRYAPAAQTHLNQGRLEEAERVAAFAQTQDLPEDAKAVLGKVLSEVQRKRSLAAGAAEGAAARVRSEVIRRPNPALILKQRRSPMVVVAWLMAGVVLAGGVAAYFIYRSHTSTVNEDDVAQVGALLTMVDELMANRKYSQAMELLQVNPRDETQRKRVNEKRESVRKSMDSEIVNFCKQARAAFDSKNEERIQGVVTESAAIDKFSSELSEDIKKTYSEIQLKVKTWKNIQREKEFDKRLAEAQAGEQISPEEQTALLNKIMQDGPPEKIAAQARDRLERLADQLTAAERALAKARRNDGVGDLSAAKSAYETVTRECPRSKPALEAEVKVRELTDQLRLQGQQIYRAGILIQQQQKDAARKELLKFLADNPDLGLADQAHQMLFGLNPPEEESSADQLLTDSRNLEMRGQSDEGRKKLSELLERYPNSRAAFQATWKVQVNSVPSGAEVWLNGKQLANHTPTLISVPALGLTRVLLTRKGFHDFEHVARNVREFSIEGVLERIPLLPARRLPVSATEGLALQDTCAALLHGGECLLDDLNKPTSTPLLSVRPVRAPQAPPAPPPKGAAGKAAPPAPSEAAPAGPAKLRFPLFSPPRPNAEAELLVAASDAVIWRINCATGQFRPLPLASPAQAAPKTYINRMMPDRPFLGICTDQGFECLDLGETKPRFPARTLAKGDVPTSEGLAFNQQTFFVLRSDHSLFLIESNAGKEQHIPLNFEPLGPPAWNEDSKSLGILGSDGTLLVLDGVGKQRFRGKFPNTPAFGFLNCGKGFVSVDRAGKVVAWSGLKNEELWHKDLAAPCLLPLQNVGSRYLAAVTAKELIVLETADGDLLWRTPLRAAAVSLATDENRIAVSTQTPSLIIYEVAEPETKAPPPHR